MTAHCGLEDRRYLRAVQAGSVTQSDGGLPVMRSGWAAGRRDARHAKAVEAGWVRELPDERGVYRLTEQGVAVLAEVDGRSAPVTVRRVAS
jgi:hypothetical protein